MLIQKFSPKRNRMNIWLFIYYYLITLIFLINKIGTVNKKLQRSFDEIFGEGWEEREQKANENLEDGIVNWDVIGQCQTKVLQCDHDNYLDQINEEEPTDQNESDHKNGDQSESDQQKREIVRKYYAIKEKAKQRGIKYSKKEWVKFEGILAKKLGTYRVKIYRWKTEFGMGKQKKTPKDYSVQQKREIIRKFRAIKEKLKERGVKFSRKERGKIERTIAKKMGTCLNYIYKWIKEFDKGKQKTNSNDYSDQQKREIIRKFRAIKEKMKQKGIKCSTKGGKKIDCTIAKKLGTCQSYIYKWIKEFGMGIKKKNDEFYSVEQKFEKVQQFMTMTNEYKQNGKHSKKEWQQNYIEIAKKIGVCHGTIKKWKKEIGMAPKTTDQQKREIIHKFHLIKQKIKQKGIKCLGKERNKIENTITKKLGTNRTEIYKWIKEFGIVSRIIDESKKYELVQKFIAMSNEYKQKRTYSKKEWEQNYAKISKKIGVSYTTIQKWKKQFGMSKEKKRYTNEEKLEAMKQYWEMKRNMPNISERKIIETLQISGRSIRTWKTEFEKN